MVVSLRAKGGARSGRERSSDRREKYLAWGMTRPDRTDLAPDADPPRHDHLFVPLTDEGVVHRTVRGGIVVLVSQTAIFTLAILAQLLTPSDYGMLALLLIVLNFLVVISNAGLTEATLQSRLPWHLRASNLYRFNFLVGCVMAVVCAAGAPGAFAQSKRLSPLARRRSGAWTKWACRQVRRPHGRRGIARRSQEAQ